MYNENNRKYTLNKHFFKTWSREMAYMLGYIYADGSLDRSKYRLRIASIDIEILNKFNIVFASNRPIRKESNKKGEWYVLTVDSIDIHRDLVSLGIVPGKTYLDISPNPPVEYLLDFFRGVFDGDGCVYSKKAKDSSIPVLALDIATMSGSLKDKFLIAMSDIIDETHGFSIQRRNNDLYILRSNAIVSERFYNKIYYDKCLCLERKKEKFKSILKERENRKIKISKAHIV